MHTEGLPGETAQSSATVDVSPSIRGDGRSSVDADALALHRRPAPETTSVTAASLSGSASPVIAIMVLAAAHFLVDVSAGTISPLWQGFEDHFEVRRGGLLWVYVGWSIATSFAQLFFAWWADRAPRRWLVWLGPLIGIVCVGLAGLAPSPVVLALLLVIGGLGIAAFHPEGAAAAGMAYPSRRSRMMAIFALWGYLGQSIGPSLSAWLTTKFGLPALVWIGAAGVAVLAGLWSQHAQVPTPPARTKPAPSQSGERAGLGTWLLLLAVGTLRIIPSIGVPLVIAYWLTDRGHIGASQSAFMFGIGTGSILCAVFVGPGRERRVLWLLPLAASPCLATIPYVPQALLPWIVGGTGFVLGIALPVFISFGQQMLPHHPRAASSMTMGVSWGSAGMIAAGTVKLFTAYGSLPDMFYVLAASSLAAGLLSLKLPAIEKRAV